MYLTYEDYQDMGGTLDETTFESLSFEACAYIDYVTFNRLEHDEVVSDKVKQCVYYLINLLKQKMDAMESVPADGSGSGGLGIASQSNDGVSVSYNVMSAKDVLTSCEDEMQKAVKMYLQGVTNTLGRKVLYRGLYPGE